MYVSEINPKQFEIGQLVYFTNDIGSSLDWGIIEEVYSDGYAIALYEKADCRIVEGIPVAKYDFHQKPRKLPKNWSWDYDLVGLAEDYHRFVGFKYSYEKPDSLKKAIEIGFFVRPNSQDRAGYPEAKVTKDGYQIVWKHDLYSLSPERKRRANYAVVNWRYIYSTYNEAKSIIDAYNAELKRQASLSEYNWALELIDKTLCRADFLDKEYKAKIRQWLIDNVDIEDIDIRIANRHVEWKRERNNKWKTLDHDLL